MGVRLRLCVPLIDHVWHIYHQVINFEKAAAILGDAAVKEAMAKADISSNAMMHWMCDNADWNESTLHGKGGWHVMAIMMAITPFLEFKKKVPTAKVTDEEIMAVPGPQKLPSPVAAAYADETFPTATEAATAREVEAEWGGQDGTQRTVDLSYKVTTTTADRIVAPLFAKFHVTVQEGEHPGQTRFFFHPFVEAKPDSDEAVYSTLVCILECCEAAGVVPHITFDQPLYERAFKIRNRMAALPGGERWKNLILHLGLFHTIMSYMGSIGHRMEGSGIQEALEQAYGSGAAEHLLAGKAHSRAVRAHQIVHKALYEDLVLRLVDNEILGLEEDELAALKTDLATLNDAYDTMLATSETTVAGEKACQDAAERVDAKLQDLRAKLAGGEECKDGGPPSEKHRTAKLWLGYLDQVDLLLTTIKAERTSNFKLTLTCIRAMLPHFAHAGRHRYVHGPLPSVLTLNGAALLMSPPVPCFLALVLVRL